jgi:NDP-sugar pyrophosphorylase family protein
MKRALIVSGGLGTRLHPLTKVIPKPLLPIGNRTLLERHVEALARSGFDEVIIVVRYFNKLFTSVAESFPVKYSQRVRIIGEESPLGTFGSVLNVCRELLDDCDSTPVIVANADVVSDLDLGSFYSYAEQSHHVMAVVVNDYTCTVPYGVVDTDANLLVAVREKPEVRFPVLAGIYAVRPTLATHVAFDGTRQMGVDQVLTALISSQQSVGVYRHVGRWIDAGTLDDLLKANELFTTEN